MFTCSVCQEWFTSSSHVSVLQCGHLYHEICISTWLKDHNTCPQCRSKLRDKPFRAYFNVDDSPQNSLPSNIRLLQDRLEQTTSKLESAKEELNKYVSICMAEKLVSSNLREKILKLEADLQTEKCSKAALKLLLSTRDRELQEARAWNLEAEKIKQELSELKGLEIILKGTSANVTKLLGQTARTPSSFRQLCTYIEVIKQQMEKNKRSNKLLTSENQIYIKENQALKKTIAELTRTKTASVTASPRCNTTLGNITSQRYTSERRPLSPLQESTLVKKPAEKAEEKKSVPAENNYGARPIVVATSRSALTNKSTATKRGPTVYTGLGGSANVSLSGAMPFDEHLAVLTKRPKTDAKGSSAAAKASASTRPSATKSNAPTASTSRDMRWL